MMESTQSFSIKLFRGYLNTIGHLFPKQAVKRLVNLFSRPQSRVIRPKEIEILKTAKTSTINVKHQKIVTYQWGESDQKALLCHGWESNAGSLGAFVSRLLNMGYEVISFDGPAHGKSDGKSSDLFDFAEIANVVNQNYGGCSVFIGHSLGANVLIFLSKQYQIPMEKCILISPINEVSAVFKKFQEQLNIPNHLYQKMLLEIENISGYRTAEMNFNKIARASKIQEALILHDINDQVTPFRHAEALKEGWQNAELKSIQGSGHYKILWHKSSLNALTDFLKN